MYKLVYSTYEVEWDYDGNDEYSIPYRFTNSIGPWYTWKWIIKVNQ